MSRAVAQAAALFFWMASGRAGGGRGHWHDGRYIDEDYEPTPEEKQEVVERIVEKLQGLKSRNDRMMIEAGWTEHEVPPIPCYDSDTPGSVWIPPGWRLVRKGEGGT